MEENKHKCRVCLIKSSETIKLNSRHIVCDKVMTISDIIMACTSIQITENDVFPQYICNLCINNANVAYNFIKLCEQSDSLLKLQLNKNKTDDLFVDKISDEHVIQDTCPFKDLENTKATITLRSTRRTRQIQPLITYTDVDSEKSISDDDCKDDIKLEYSDIDDTCKTDDTKPNEINNALVWHKILKHFSEKNENGVYECISCTETFDALHSLQTHVKSHTTFVCKLCNKVLTTLSNLRRHLRAHANKNDIYAGKYQLITQNYEKSTYNCISCAKTFNRRKQLSEHLKSHKDFICRICSTKFTLITNLRKHLRWHNRSKDVIKINKPTPVEQRTCDICMKVFKYRPSMMKHRKRHSMLGKECSFCHMVFDSSMKLHHHMEDEHKQNKNIVCSTCGKRFFREWNLKKHMIVHSGAKPYMCEVCGVSFALVGNLASHKRLHTGHKPYKCTLCNRRFTQQSSLRSHEAGHFNKRDHVCPTCGAAFTRAGAMRNHHKRHETSKNYPCSMCDKRFTFSSERKRHMMIHTGEKNYVCDFCGKAFNRPANLTVHRRIHTGEQPHRCAECGKGFIQAHCLKTHMHSHHRPVIVTGNAQSGHQEIILGVL